MPHTILFNALLQGAEPDGRIVVRYLQTGVAGANGFSGIVTDYCGGGEWDDLYYFEDAPIDGAMLGIDDGEDGEDGEDDEAEELDGDDYEEFLDARLPDLIEAIHTARKNLIEWIDEPSIYPVATGELLDLIGEAVNDTEQLFSDAPGALPPADGFNTNF